MLGSSTALRSLLLASLAPLAVAHMSLWSDSQYGFRQPYEAVTPLSNKPFSQWWFHGYTADTPSGIMTITAGQPLTVQIACHKKFSTYGDQPSTDACPSDSGAYHAGGVTNTQNGWTGNTESMLMGCALAIAPTPNAASTRPEDFVVMSILENCVRRRDTTFAIPANLPTCPDGVCTCAWFWQGRNSDPEMYMTGFRCKVVGGVATPFPTPAQPRRNAVSGPVQPQYWANDLNNIGYTPVWETRPSYDRKWGWTDGAQTRAFVVEEPTVPGPSANLQPTRRAALPWERRDYQAILQEANASSRVAAAARASATSAAEGDDDVEGEEEEGDEADVKGQSEGFGEDEGDARAGGDLAFEAQLGSRGHDNRRKARGHDRQKRGRVLA